MTFAAHYIGGGCFIHCRLQYLVFVKREFRPDYLVEGRTYDLKAELQPGGAVLFKIAEKEARA